MRISPSISASVALSIIAAGTVLAQGSAVPVRFTEAVEQSIRGSVKVSGTVETRRSSVVASEMSGVVVNIDAREGDFVRKGSPLVRLRADNTQLRLRAAEAELREANARLDLSRQSRERAEKLSRDGLISQQQLDDALTEEEAWLGRVGRLGADVERLRNDLNRMTVRAPFTGVVVEEKTSLGEWVQAGGDVVELIDAVNLEVTVSVPERYFTGLELGSAAQVRIPALGGTSIAGKVRAIVPRANPQARTFPVKVVFENPGTKAAIGMLAETTLSVGGARPRTLVPKDAIVRQGSSTGVWLIGRDSMISWTEVETGSAAGAWVEVSGVSPRARIVTRGNERLRAGQTVSATRQEYPRP